MDDYIRVADELGAKRFSIPPEIWGKMDDVERWAANTKFLDRMIARGDEVVLSNSAYKAEAGSVFVYIPEDVDPPFRFMLTHHSGDVAPPAYLLL